MHSWTIWILCSSLFFDVQSTVINIPDTGQVEYTYFTDKRTWNTAWRVCLGVGGRLASIDSQETLDIIKTLADNVWNIVGWDHVWMGLYRVSAAADDFRWSDSQCSNLSVTGWTNFKSNDDSYSSSQRCYQLKKDNFEWERKNCKDEKKFICETIWSSDSCNYGNTGTHLISVTLSTATATTCQAQCEAVSGCVMAAVASTQRCTLAITSSNSSTQLYYKDCQVLSSVNESVTDSYKEADDTSETPTACQSSNITTNEVSISIDTLPFDSSTVIESLDQVTVTMTTCVTDSSTPIEPSSCIPLIVTSTVVSTVFVTPTPVMTSQSEIQSSTGYTSSLCPCDYSSFLSTYSTLMTSSTDSSLTTSFTDSMMMSSIESSYVETVTSSSVESNVLCTTFNNTELSREQLRNVLDAIVDRLIVDTTKLSTTTRKKTSAPDSRPSSTSMGYTAAGLMLIPFILLMFADIPVIVRQILLNRVKY